MPLLSPGARFWFAAIFAATRGEIVIIRISSTHFLKNLRDKMVAIDLRHLLLYSLKEFIAATQSTASDLHEVNHEVDRVCAAGTM